MNIQIFIVFAVVFFAVLIVIGIVTKKWAKGASDFALAGREVGMVISVSGIMAIAFAGTSLSLAPAFAISHGLLGSAAWGGILALGFAGYGLLFGPTIRRCGSQTLSEWMETRYSGRVRTITSLGTIVGLCGIMANNIASFAASLSTYAQIPTWVSIAICFAVIVIFTYCSGMHAVNMTNLFQMIIGAAALPLFMFLLFSKFGGTGYITANWPGPGSWVNSGFTGLSLPVLTLRYPSVLTFVLLNGIFLIWGSNYYYIRVVTCRSEKIVKSSFVVAAILKVLVVYLPLAFVGLIAVCSAPDRFAPKGPLPTAAAYGFMLFNLTAAVASFMLIASMAASLSTASTALMGATSTAARDVYQRNFNPGASELQMLMPNRIIMVLLGIFTCILCFFPGGPTYLFAFANSWMGPPAVLLFLGVFWKRFTPTAAFWSVLVGMVSMATFVVLEFAKIFVIGRYMHLCVIGLGATLLTGVILTYLTKPKYYGASGWNIDPAQGSRTDIMVEDIDRQVLKLIRDGMVQMVEICDYIGADARYVNASVEKLDLGGYIRRCGLTGADFYSFSLTAKGKAVLPEQSQDEIALAQKGLTPLLKEYLSHAVKGEEAGSAFLLDKGFRTLQFIAINSMLERNGYIAQKGHLRRHFYVTEKGRSIV